MLPLPNPRFQRNASTRKEEHPSGTILFPKNPPVVRRQKYNQPPDCDTRVFATEAAAGIDRSITPPCSLLRGQREARVSGEKTAKEPLN